MKKLVAVLAAIALAVTCVVGVHAADISLGNGSGQLTPIFDDFDPSAVTEMIAGLDFSGLLNDLGMGDIGSLFGRLDLGSLLGNMGGLGGMPDLSGLLSNLNLEDLLGGLIPGGSSTPDPTQAPSSTTPPTTAAPTPTTPPTTAPQNNIPKSGDAGLGLVVALSIAAGAAFVFTRKKTDA